MGDFDCGAIDCGDCGDCDCGDCCDECFDCGDIDCSYCCVCFSDAISGKALVRILCGLVIFAVLAAVVTLLVIALVPRRVGVSVEDAALARFALADKNATATALAYDISIAVAVQNGNWLMPAEHTAPLYADLLFGGARFARVGLATAGAVVRPRRREVYHATAAADSASVVLGSAAVAEFARESTAGVFQLELRVLGEVRYRPHHKLHRLDAICRLELALSTATSPAMFRKVKCNVQKDHGGR
uniref:Late embryogenesis abundant protein LEA-2 subgroup domain-containing protein n=1 Tax=Aegilops tauschii subsp. strangulata TaxID=200361 RepID=A0A453N2E1_AEGTS